MPRQTRAPFTVWLSPEERRRLEAVRARHSSLASPSLSNIARTLLVRSCDAELAGVTTPPAQVA